MFNILLFLTFTVSSIYFYAKYKYSYWKRKGVAFLKPTFPIGNAPLTLPKGLSFGMISKRLYDQFKPTGCKLGGIYFGFDPKLVVMDPKYAEHVLKTDFSYFVDRGTYLNENYPLTVNIFTQNGDDWRSTRGKFSSMFSSAKTKMMFETLKACNTDLEEYLEECAKKSDYINIMEIMCCYNTDVIGSVIFGVECNSFKNSDAMFRKIGKAVFGKFSLLDRLQMYLAIYHPNLARKIGVTNIQEGVKDFFNKIIKDSVEYREKNNIYRPDFLQMLIESKKVGNISLEEMAAQTFLFFAAGFETSSNTSSFLLWELALHQDWQQQVRNEIKMVLKKYDNNINYDALKEMPLFERAFKETLRKDTTVSTLVRVCVKDYTFRDSDVTIPKGMKLLIPIFGYHRDADYYPEPLKWNPDRFLDKDQKHYGYLPFGEGPRNCIGIKFGVMQVKMGVLSVLKHYRVTVDPNIKLPIEYDQDTFLAYPTQPLMLKLHRED